MQRIQDPTAVADRPAMPALTGPAGYFFNGNPGANVPSTIVPDWWVNMMQEENIALLLAAGLPIDGSATVLQAIKILFGTPMTTVLATGSVTVPAWATRVEMVLQGAGGGGGNCQATSLSSTASGGGGGAGGTLHGIWAVTAGETVSFTIGAGGAFQTAGGATIAQIGGVTAGTANGGAGSIVVTASFAAGGSGGTVSATGAAIILANNGQPGGDGQAGNFILSGYGGSSPYGGGGRAGSHAGFPGQGFGSGGGGAYDASLSGTTFTAASGANGVAFSRFLP